MSRIDKAVNYAVDVANNNSHGYSQVYRWPEQGSSFDCSSLVISAWQYGANVPVRDAGASYTGNMYDAFVKCGFVNVSALVNFATGTGLVKGDVLLNHENHAAMYIGNGQVVHARSSEGTSDQIDSSGNEIRCQSYWNYPWDVILRYEEELDDSDHVESGPLDDDDIDIVEPEPVIPYNTKSYKIAMIQGGLKYFGYSLGWYGIDGDSGGANSYTNRAINQAIEDGCYSAEFLQDFMREEVEL